MSRQIEWPEYIKEHIETVMWRGGQIEKTVASVMDDVTVWVLEDGKLPDLIWSVTGNSDSHTVGEWFKEIVEKNLSSYCLQMQDELKDQFPEEYAEFQETDEGDEVSV